MEKRNTLKCLSAAHLKIFAMATMLCDHMWATVLTNQSWLTAVGRLAFPIFAFQIAEGYARTGNYKQYLKRMFLFALISEIPFNLITSGGLINPFHQNVMFTFCIALVVVRRIDLAWQWGWKRGALATVGYGLLGYVLGFVTFVDYFGYGVWMVLLFALTRERSWGWFAQLAGMIVINVFMLKGLSFVIEGAGREIWVPQQALAVLALIPIWLYNGSRGSDSKAFQYACYAFYPAHILVLSVLCLYIL